MFAVFVVFEYSDIRPAALKIITPTSTSHKMASSVAFLSADWLYSLVKVTHRWRSFGIFSIFIFFRPMLESCTPSGRQRAPKRGVCDVGDERSRHIEANAPS